MTFTAAPEFLGPTLREVCRIAESAGKLALAMQHDAREAYGVKKDSSLVTDADRACEALIRQELGPLVPGAGFLGEENGGEAGGLYWVVDPIDGTSNYVGGIPIWCVSIALMQDDRGILGVVHDPNAGETFSAAKGKGAELNGVPLPATGTGRTRPVACMGFPAAQPVSRSSVILEALREMDASVRSLGASALCMCYLAAGRFDLFLEGKVNIWDVAAASVMVEETGGTVLTGWSLEEPTAAFGAVASRNGLADQARTLFKAVVG